MVKAEPKDVKNLVQKKDEPNEKIEEDKILKTERIPKGTIER